MDKFSPKHFMFLIWGVSIISMKTYPRVFIEDGLRDSWIAVIISSILAFLFFVYIIKKWISNNKIGFVDVYHSAFGNKLGNFFLFLFIINCFFILIECSSIEADSMHQNMLILTPQWYFLLFFIVPVIYVIRRDLVAIVTVTLIGISMIMLAGTNLGMLTTSYKDPNLLFPIFSDGITSGFLLSIIETLGQYGCLAIVLPYLDEIVDTKNKMVLYVVLSLVVLIQIEIVSITGVLMTFTVERSISINYPKLTQTQLVSYMQFFDFGELYVMLQILGGWIIKYFITFYGILIILKKLTNITKKNLNKITYCLSALVFICSYFACQDAFLLFELLDVLQYISLFNFIIIPLLAYTLVNTKKKMSTFLKDNSHKMENTTPDNDPFQPVN